MHSKTDERQDKEIAELRKEMNHVRMFLGAIFVKMSITEAEFQSLHKMAESLANTPAAEEFRAFTKRVLKETIGAARTRDTDR